MTWEDKVMPYSSGNIYSYTPCQVRAGATLAERVSRSGALPTLADSLRACADGGHNLDYLRCVRGSVHNGCQEQQRGEQEGSACGNRRSRVSQGLDRTLEPARGCLERLGDWRFSARSGMHGCYGAFLCVHLDLQCKRHVRRAVD